MGESLNKKAKFYIFLLLGIFGFTPFLLLYIRVQMFLYAILFFLGFLAYCIFLYRFVYKKVKPKYPLVPPEGRMDIYFPRTDIPRPLYEDMQRYPEFFKRKKRRYDRTRRVKKKS
jgi:Ca2+/Na+ antiporter